MKLLSVARLEQLPIEDLSPLLDESRTQGFDFLDRLVTDYINQTNRFSASNEALFGVYRDNRMIAIGGLNTDPYLPDLDAGRVRHVYVLSARRNRGIGRTLMARIIGAARQHYRLLTLRTLTPEADRFYRALGFQTRPEIASATHHLMLAP